MSTLQTTRLKRHITALNDSLTKKKRAKRSQLGGSVVLRTLRDQDYDAQFLGGRNCARITVPILTLDQIKAAALMFRELGEALQACTEQPGSQLGKVLEARNLCGQASTILKGGVSYKGAR